MTNSKNYTVGRRFHMDGKGLVCGTSGRQRFDF